MTRTEHLTIGLVALALWGVSGLPLWVGWLSTPADQVYVARVPITGADTTAYYSDIEQARQGGVLVSNQFTSEPQRPTLFHPLWLFTGWLGALTSWSTPAAYQAARLLAAWAFVLLLYRILMTVSLRPAGRWLVLAVVVTSSGLGWLTRADWRGDVQLNSTPVDLWVAESNTFLSIGHSALFIGSQALLLFILWQGWLLWAGQVSRGKRWIGPALGLLALIHPYDLFTVVAVLVASFLWLTASGRWPGERWREMVVAGLQWLVWVLPVVVYYLVVVLREPAMAGWLRQNVDTTSPPHLVFLAFGLLWPLAAIGLLADRHRRPSVLTLFFIWAMVGLAVIYLPGLTFQRRLLNGLHLPISLLAGWGLVMMSQRLRPAVVRWTVVSVMIAVLALSNLRSLALDAAQVFPDAKPHYPARISRAEYEAMLWLKAHSRPTDVVWSEVWMGNTIPGVSGRTVALGHGHQTIDLQGRLRDWEAWRTDSLAPAERTEMLRRLRINLLFWRAKDKLPGGYRPETDQRWQLVFQKDDVRLFQL